MSDLPPREQLEETVGLMAGLAGRIYRELCNDGVSPAEAAVMAPRILEVLLRNPGKS